MFAWRAFGREPGATSGAYLTVPELERRGIRVAFTSRHGGNSGEPFSSLNLSYSSGDDPGTVRANRSRALAVVGGRLDSWTGARQVHGTRIVRVSGAERGAGWDSPARVIADADGLWTETPDVTIVVLTADCTPVVLADPERRRIGVVHAGWRGLLAGVIESAVEGMGRPAGLRAFIGPSIGPCCYDVGPDVAGPARERLGDVVRIGPARRAGRGAGVAQAVDAPVERLDLWAGSLRALARAGVRDVWPAALCTRCEPGRFYSHRAGAAGRQGVLARIAS